jgi:hypothetical protein
MIPQGVQVFVALDTVDLRCSFDRLAGLAREQVGYDARSGALFVFYGRRCSMGYKSRRRRPRVGSRFIDARITVAQRKPQSHKVRPINESYRFRSTAIGHCDYKPDL